MEVVDARTDEAAICARFAPRVRAYGLLRLRDRTQADDLVQHVLLALVVALRAGRVPDPYLEGFVFGTCRNAVMAMRRGTTRQRRIADEAGNSLPQDYVPSWRALDTKALERCLLLLEARDRSVVISTFIEEREADEIARTMQLSAGNVRVIRHRAMAKLQTCIAQGAAA